MMKKKLVLITAVLALAGLSGCNKNIVDSLVGDFAVTKVSVDPTYATVEAGESLNLTSTVTFKDEQQYTYYQEWRSSNSKIATVSDSGEVKALKPGNVSITFIAGFKSASCSVTVPDNASPVIPVDPENLDSGATFSISLNASSITLVLDGDTSEGDVHDNFQLSATTSEQATVTWSSSDESVATVDQNGLVLAIGEGDAVITASANGVSETCDVTVLTEAWEDVKPDEDMNIEIYFFLDYNNVDEDDLTGKKLLAKFWWYDDEEHPLSASGKVPSNPTSAMAPTSAFPYFAGWSTHPLIDTKDDLLVLTDGAQYAAAASGRTYLYIYGIWTDVQGGMNI